MALTLKYCTRCDKDISSSTGGVCPQCQSTTHSIAIDVYEKCDNCGGTWIGHGNQASGSACRGMAGFFTPNAASPTMPQGYTSQSVILAFNQAKQRFMSGQSYPSVAAHASPSNGGAKCSKCGDFNEYAQAKPDGSFTCFGCRR